MKGLESLKAEFKEWYSDQPYAHESCLKDFQIWIAGRNSMNIGDIYALITCAQAVVDRWETPLWKDAEPTATVIYRLRDALEKLK